MQKNILELSFAAAAGIVAGFIIQRFFYNNPSNKIVKVISNAGSTLGITQVKDVQSTSGTTIGVTTAPPITEAEKIELFHTARGYTGGANPPKHVLDAAKAAAVIAQAKSDTLGLRAEYNNWLIKITSLPKPV